MHCAYHLVRVPYRYQQYVGTPVRTGKSNLGLYYVICVSKDCLTERGPCAIDRYRRNRSSTVDFDCRQSIEGEEEEGEEEEGALLFLGSPTRGDGYLVTVPSPVGCSPGKLATIKDVIQCRETVVEMATNKVVSNDVSSLMGKGSKEMGSLYVNREIEVKSKGSEANQLKGASEAPFSSSEIRPTGSRSSNYGNHFQQPVGSQKASGKAPYRAKREKKKREKPSSPTCCSSPVRSCDPSPVGDSFSPRREKRGDTLQISDSVVPNTEWKPKSAHTDHTQASGIAGNYDVPMMGNAVSQSVSVPASCSVELEETISKLEKKLDEVQLSARQHVIIPDHLQVTGSERHGLSFGSFDACFNVDFANGDKCDQSATQLSGSLQENEKNVEHPSSWSDIPLSGSSPLATQAVGAMQSSGVVSQQPVPIFRQPAGSEEGSAAWIQAPGQDNSSLQATTFYSVLPRMTFAPPTQTGHGAFGGIYHPAPAAVHPLVQQSQAAAGEVEMVGPAASVYQQQPQQHAQINWTTNY
ncbi:hypothetical protein GW17_00016857 [Ensete ventricosum]|nr:hypothetical protein GW17_00016857 [Ensete ventricosum]